jgi:hypothetical protein
MIVIILVFVSNASAMKSPGEDGGRENDGGGTAAKAGSFPEGRSPPVTR